MNHNKYQFEFDEDEFIMMLSFFEGFMKQINEFKDDNFRENIIKVYFKLKKETESTMIH